MTMTSDTNGLGTDLVFDLTLTAEQEAIRTRLHRLAKDVLRPAIGVTTRDEADLATLTKHLDRAGCRPADLLSETRPDPLTAVVAVEELAYGDSGAAWVALTEMQALTLVARCGSEGQRRALQQRLVADPATTVSVLLYEDFGRAPSEYETLARATGGTWDVTGRKASVVHPATADVAVLVARDAAGGEPALFLVEGREGLTGLRDDRAAGKLALTDAPSGPVAIDGLILADDAALDDADSAVDAARAIAAARLLVAAALIGTARASVEFAAAYALERSSFGRKLSEYQGVTFPLVEHATLIDEARLLVWDVATSLDRIDEVEELEHRTGRALARTSDVALRATRDGVQLIGVRGITRELPCEGWYRAAGVLAALDYDPLFAPVGL